MRKTIAAFILATSAAGSAWAADPNMMTCGDWVALGAGERSTALNELVNFANASANQSAANVASFANVASRVKEQGGGQFDVPMGQLIDQMCNGQPVDALIYDVVK